MNYVDWFNFLPDWLATVLIAMTPVAEYRIAIPVALGVYKMPVLPAIFFTIIGDMIPSVLILLFIGRVSIFLRKRSILSDRFFKWWFANVKKKFSGGLAKYGILALFLFVAVPFPGTGSWSGAVAAFLFGLPFFPSLAAILGGAMIAVSLVTGASLGIFSFF